MIDFDYIAPEIQSRYIDVIRRTHEAFKIGGVEFVGESPCMWTYDDRMDAWNTECGNAFQIMNDTPKENEFEYCPYCGGNLIEAVKVDDE